MFIYLYIYIDIFGNRNRYKFRYMFTYVIRYLTYLPHKAVAEAPKDKEPIGRECVEFNWFESQLMSDSNELRVK